MNVKCFKQKSHIFWCFHFSVHEPGSRYPATIPTGDDNNEVKHKLELISFVKYVHYITLFKIIIRTEEDFHQ